MLNQAMRAPCNPLKLINSSTPHFRGAPSSTYPHARSSPSPRTRSPEESRPLHTPALRCKFRASFLGSCYLIQGPRDRVQSILRYGMQSRRTHYMDAYPRRRSGSAHPTRACAIRISFHRTCTLDAVFDKVTQRRTV